MDEQLAPRKSGWLNHLGIYGRGLGSGEVSMNISDRMRRLDNMRLSGDRREVAGEREGKRNNRHAIDV